MNRFGRVMDTALPFSQACANNQAPIAEVLSPALAHCRQVLEVGSGTGQHSVYLAPRLPHLAWQTSDLPALLPGIRAWHAAQPAPNLPEPLAFDLASDPWPLAGVDAVFTANTLHIVAWPLVQRLLRLVGEHVMAGGVLAVYGPFNYHGDFTSESNRAFDAMLRERDPTSGIRDAEVLMALAAEHGLALRRDHAMPANNRLLVFGKD